MSNVMTVALQFTAIDMARGIVERIRRNILSLGQSAGQVKRDFDDMSRHVTAGLKAIAVSAYALQGRYGTYFKISIQPHQIV